MLDRWVFDPNYELVGELVVKMKDLGKFEKGLD